MALLLWLSSVHIWHSLLKLLAICQCSLCGGGRTDAQKHPTHTHTHTASHRSLCSQAWATPDSHTQTNAHSDTQTFDFHSFKRKSLMSFHKCCVFSFLPGAIMASPLCISASGHLLHVDCCLLRKTERLLSTECLNAAQVVCSTFLFNLWLSGLLTGIERVVPTQELLHIVPCGYLFTACFWTYRSTEGFLKTVFVHLFSQFGPK